MQDLELLTALINVMPDAVLLLDSCGRILAANTPVAVLLGYADGELEGTKLDVLVINEVPPESAETGRTAWLFGQTEPLLLKRKDGTFITATMAVSQLALTREDFFSCVIQNRSEIEALEQTVRELRETNRQKSRLVSVASHEFRTPLSNIQLSANLVAHYFDRLDKTKILTHIHKIDQAVAEMTGTLNDLLSLEKIESGSSEQHKIWLDLEDYCQVSADGFKNQLWDGQHLVCQFKGRTKKVFTDEHLLRHCLNNLLSNAIKYSPGGGTVRLESVTENLNFRIAVSDEGIGIPEEDQAKLFQPFFRAGNVGDIPGTGLGLSIVQKCAEMMGGTVHLESSPGNGCRFTITLPVSGAVT